MSQLSGNQISVIGMDVCGTALSREKQVCIAGADVLVGGKKQFDKIGTFTGQKIEITGNIQSTLKEIQKVLDNGKQVAVLATGDPLLFGIGNTLIAHFGKDAVLVYPGISAVQAALTRLGLSADNVAVVSRHSQHHMDLTPLMTHATGIVLTSPGCDSPDVIQELVLTWPWTKTWQGHVCQRLGMADDIIDSGPLHRLGTHGSFKAPNILVVENPAPVKRSGADGNFGLPDPAYAHEQGMITHPEVRAVTLSKLRLDRISVVWDVGAGSGSVGIEAAKLNPFAAVYAVEQHQHRYDHILANKEAHQVPNLFAVHGSAVEACHTLPTPDRVFIGGGGAAISELLDLCHQRLAPRGRMVVNTITVESAEAVNWFCKKMQARAACITLSISRQRPLAKYHVMTPENPITLFTIEK